MKYAAVAIIREGSTFHFEGTFDACMAWGKLINDAWIIASMSVTEERHTS